MGILNGRIERFGASMKTPPPTPPKNQIRSWFFLKCSNEVFSVTEHLCYFLFTNFLTMDWNFKPY